LEQGDLLANLELKDPSKVKKIVPFSGTLPYDLPAAKSESTLRAFRTSSKALELAMDGRIRVLFCILGSRI